MAPPLIRENIGGFYGFPTSTMDWCEENYAVTYLIGEFWNTISNWIMIFPPLIVAHHLWKHNLAETRYIAALLSLAAIGFGSFAFHCTLLYQSQLLDELPMIYGTCIMLYCIWHVNSKENFFHVHSFSLLCLVGFLVTVIYLSFVNPLIFLWSYGLLAACLFLFNMHGLLKYNGNRPLFALSCFVYIFGFILWNIDNEFCFSVRALRSSLPGFLRPTTQLHALWHTFAGAGTYLSIVYSLQLRYKCLGYDPVKKHLYNYIPYYEKGYNNLYDVNGNATSKPKQLNDVLLSIGKPLF